MTLPTLILRADNETQLKKVNTKQQNIAVSIKTYNAVPK